MQFASHKKQKYALEQMKNLLKVLNLLICIIRHVIPIRGPKWRGEFQIKFVPVSSVFRQNFSAVIVIFT